MVRDAVVLAGGAGTRLWPASRAGRPKQFLDFQGDGPLLVQAIRRAALVAADRILIVTHHSQVAPMGEILSGLDSGLRGRISVIPEPEARNTAPALALAACFLGPDSRRAAVVLAADHIIGNEAIFASDCASAGLLAEEGLLVTFAIAPTRPETGYGYIELGPARGPGYAVAAFREKPDEATAREYLSTGRHFWNSGMFVFTPADFLTDLERFAPELALALGRFTPAEIGVARGDGGISVVDLSPAITDAYTRVPKISVDYAVFEHTDRAATVVAGFSWSDVGSWDEAARLAVGEGSLPTASDSLIEIGCSGNYVYADGPVALCGVDNLIVVKDGDRLLICRRGSSQLVRDVVQRLQEEGRDDLL